MLTWGLGGGHGAWGMGHGAWGMSILLTHWVGGGPMAQSTNTHHTSHINAMPRPLLHFNFMVTGLGGAGWGGRGDWFGGCGLGGSGVTGLRGAGWEGQGSLAWGVRGGGVRGHWFGGCGVGGSGVTGLGGAGWGGQGSLVWGVRGGGVRGHWFGGVRGSGWPHCR